MMRIDFTKIIAPHLIAGFVFLAVTVTFFAPVIFEGKILPQHDITQYLGSAQELKSYRAGGDEIKWTNSMFGGMPTYLLGASYEGELTQYAHLIMSVMLPHPVSLVFISFVSCYIMLLVFGVRPWVSIAGALAFGLTDFSIIGLMAGHNSKIGAVAFIPLVMAGIHLAFTKNRWKGMLLTALGLALQIRLNHLQITYYLLLIVLFYGIYQLVESFRSRTMPNLLKTVGILTLGAMLALGANFSKLWTVYEYGNYSTRGKSELVSPEKTDSKSGLDRDYVFSYSNGIIEPLFLFIPNFMGGSMQEDLGKDSNLEQALKANGANRRQIKQQTSSAPTYWGHQPLTAPYYAGAITVFLFVLGMIHLDGRFKWWMLGVACFGIILSWGHNFSSFNNAFFDYFPFYNKFRSVTFTIIMTVFSMVLIGFLGVEKLLTNGWNGKKSKDFYTAVASVGGFALLCVVFAGMGSYVGGVDAKLASYPSWYMNALRADRAELLRSDALRSLFFVAAFAGVLWLYMKNKLNGKLAYALMVLFVLVDMFGVAKRFINYDSFQKKSRNKSFAKTDADQAILEDSAISYRVFNLMNPFNDAITSYHHKSVGGYHGAKMGRYQDLITHHLSNEHNKVISKLRSGQINFDSIPVLNMLNTKYFIAGESENAVIQNRGANGNAWFVDEIIEVNNPQEEIDRLGKLNSSTSAIVDNSKFDVDLDVVKDSMAVIALTQYHPEHLVYQSNSLKKGLVVFSEIYYPKGWIALIDGVETSIIRANYILRSLEVPAGQHKIEFQFKPKSYQYGTYITWSSNIVLLLMILSFLGMSMKKNED